MIKNVLIGIQARSTSQRLPGKALANLYNKPVLSWVLNACHDSSNFLNKQKNIKSNVAILCPVGDKIIEHYKQFNVLEGSEHNVLSRYMAAAEQFNADYIVRITGDCPFLTGYLISNHVLKAIDNRLDYISNVDPDIRTELDGRDVEVLSRNALNWLNANAMTPFEKEHVTIKLYKEKPKILRRGYVLNRLDLSDFKLSIDTEEDLIKSNQRMQSFFMKKLEAEKDVGQNNIFYV